MTTTTQNDDNAVACILYMTVTFTYNIITTSPQSSPFINTSLCKHYTYRRS